MQTIAAAVVSTPQGYWLVRRGPQQSHPGMWEFPGGKVEPGEAPEQALQREILEEMGVEVAVGRLLARAIQGDLELQAFEANLLGSPQLLEHDAQEYVPRQRLLDYPMTRLDQDVVQQLP